MFGKVLRNSESLLSKLVRFSWLSCDGKGILSKSELLVEECDEFGVHKTGDWLLVDCVVDVPGGWFADINGCIGRGGASIWL